MTDPAAAENLLSGTPKGGLSGGVLPSGAQPYVADDATHWRDWPWAIAFYVHFACILLLAFGYGTSAVTKDAISINGNSASSAEPFDLNADILIRAIVLAIFSGCVTSLVMFSLLQRLGGALIRVSFFVSITINALAGAALVGIGLVPAGAILLFFALLTAAYYTCIRRRIAFAAAHLNVASSALRGSPGVVGLAVMLLLMQTVWSIVWGLAALGVEWLINNQQNQDCSYTPGACTGGGGSGGTGLGGTFATFAMLLSFFWGSGVIANISSFSSASVTGDYWYKGSAARAPVWGALRRALTTSFGTISLGAFLVALCAALRAMLDAAKASTRRNRDASPLLLALMCVAGCLLWLLQAVLEWANRWAIVYAALTGLAFKPAGLAAVALFRERGWDEVLNADLVASALRMASLVSASFGALAGGGLAWTLDKSPQAASHAGVAAGLCFFVGMALALVRGWGCGRCPPCASTRTRLAPHPPPLSHTRTCTRFSPTRAGAHRVHRHGHARRVCGLGAGAGRAAGHAPGAPAGAGGRVARGAPRAVSELRVRARVRRGGRGRVHRAAAPGRLRDEHSVRRKEEGRGGRGGTK